MPLLQLQSLHHPILCNNQTPKPLPPHSSHQPPFLLQFKTSRRRRRRQNLHYLRNLGITSLPTSPSAETLHCALYVVDFLKSKGFSDSDFSRLSFLAPSIFSSIDIDRTLNPIFGFLCDDVSASPQQARGLILRCPSLLASNATYRLRPTFSFLRELGIKNLNTPTNLNAHLLNTPTEKLVSKIEFLEEWGLKREEVGKICGRFPAVFGYNIENNLRPKVEYLVYEMGWPIEELKVFPQFFAFSLEGRIVPRHLHLKQRNVRIAPKRMLLCSNDKFYAKWK